VDEHYVRINKPPSMLLLGRPAIQVRSKGKIVLNPYAYELLSQANVTRVWILWDAECCRVALKAAPSDDPAAYKVWHSKYHRVAFISSQTFFTRIYSHYVEPDTTVDHFAGRLGREGATT